MELVDELIRDLNESGTLVEPGDQPHEYLILGRRGSRFDPPIPLHVDATELHRSLDLMSPDAASAFPDVPPREAAYRLLLIDIEENLDRTGTPAHTMTITAGELVVTTSADDTDPNDLPHDAIGHLHWTTHRPHPQP